MFSRYYREDQGLQNTSNQACLALLVKKVLWCLLSCVSGGTMLDKLYPSMPDEESDVSPGEDDSLISYMNMAIIDHVQDMLSEMSQNSETTEMSGKMGFGNFFCFGNVEKYRSCNEKCNKLSITERTACKLMNFTNRLVACFSGSMECDERWTVTVTSKVGECNSNCNCGTSNERHQKIYGGSEVEYEVKYPWHVGILNTKMGKTAFCGGTIIGDKYVITAAHCLHIQDIDDKDISVRIGDHIQTSTVDDIEEITKTISVEKIHYHPENNKNTFVNDIALLELSQNITFTNEFGIRPICLPCLEDTDDYEGKSAITLGWGKTKQDLKEIPETLKQAEVTILDKDCENRLGEVFKPDMAVCSVSNSNKGVSCWADNGGSLFVNEGNKTHERYVLVGITLFPSCSETIPVIYTRVKSAINWIQKLNLVTTCAS